MPSPFSPPPGGGGGTEGGTQSAKGRTDDGVDPGDGRSDATTPSNGLPARTLHPKLGGEIDGLTGGGPPGAPTIDKQVLADPIRLMGSSTPVQQVPAFPGSNNPPPPECDWSER